jgi:hypothetical protein
LRTAIATGYDKNPQKFPCRHPPRRYDLAPLDDFSSALAQFGTVLANFGEFTRIAWNPRELENKGKSEKSQRF